MSWHVLFLDAALVGGALGLLGLVARYLWRALIALVCELGRAGDVVAEAVPDPTRLVPNIPGRTSPCPRCGVSSQG